MQIWLEIVFLHTALNGPHNVLGLHGHIKKDHFFSSFFVPRHTIKLTNSYTECPLLRSLVTCTSLSYECPPPGFEPKGRKCTVSHKLFTRFAGGGHEMYEHQNAVSSLQNCIILSQNGKNAFVAFWLWARPRLFLHICALPCRYEEGNLVDSRSCSEAWVGAFCIQILFFRAWIIGFVHYTVTGRHRGPSDLDPGGTQIWKWRGCAVGPQSRGPSSVID